MIRIQCTQCGAKLKAPDEAAGKTTNCPKCGTRISIPEPIYDAEAIDAGKPEPPADAYDLASDPYGLAEPASPLPPRSQAGGGNVDEGGEARRPCPMCGEMILASAAKCRFCGEVFDEGLKKATKKKKKKRRGKSSFDDDDEMSTVDWLLAIFCGGIGCIVGIVYMIQGKSKGPKMVGLSIAFNVMWGVIQRVIIEATKH